MPSVGWTEPSSTESDSRGRYRLGPETIVHSLAGLPEEAGEEAIESERIFDLCERYRLEEVAGQGGMGVVRRAWDRRVGRAVAIKRPRSGANGTRFLREARIAAGLEHPAIVRVLDVGQDREGPYLVLEWVEGNTFEAIAFREVLPPERVASIGCELASALAHAHGRGILHRDIHPGNVFLTGGQGARVRGRVRIVDFGLAAPRLSSGGPGPFGRPGFVAPEIVSGGVPDSRSEIYAAGMTLATLLVGSRPNQVALGRIGSPVGHVLAAAIDPDPERRIGSAPSLLRRLEKPGRGEVRVGRAVRACPDCHSPVRDSMGHWSDGTPVREATTGR